MASYFFYQACIKPLYYRFRFIQCGTLKPLFLLQKTHRLKDFHSISMKQKYAHLHYTPSQLKAHLILYCANNISCLNKRISKFCSALSDASCISMYIMVHQQKLRVTRRYLWCKMKAIPLPLIEKINMSIEKYIFFKIPFTFKCIYADRLNTLRTGSFQSFKRPFPGFLTIVTF